METANEFTQSLIKAYTRDYMGKVFYFCLKKTGTREDAEDLTSDISQCVLFELKKGCIPEHFSAWVWRIAKNRYSKWAIAKRKALDNISATDITELEIGDESDMEADLERNEELISLRRELALISGEYRDILVAHYIEDMPIKKIAQGLGLSEGAVKMRLMRARNILKEGMNMSREFGKKSYNPEDVNFAASGNQPSGLPWSAVQRKLPKNILLEASDNPSTLEELSIEMGIAMPYMEEEVEALTGATLLKKTGDKYITNFYIADRQTQLDIYNAQRRASGACSVLADKLADDMIPLLREWNTARNGMTDGIIKWWVLIDTLNTCLNEVSSFEANPLTRENGETWGFMGFEAVEYPESIIMGMNGNGSDDCMFFAYIINDYGIHEKIGEMQYEQVRLLGDIIKNSRNISSLSISEMEIWDSIDGKYAHADENGNIIPDILVFENGAMQSFKDALTNHPCYNDLMKIVQEVYNKIKDILKRNSNKELHSQLDYYAGMFITYLRMMTVHDEVKSGKLIVPAEPEKSTVAMWLEME